MKNITQKLIEQYADGELPLNKAKTVKTLLDNSSNVDLSVEEIKRIGSLLRLMNEETAKDVSFDGLADKVLAEIKTDRTSLSYAEKLKVWLSEVIENRRGIWIPASAIACAACLAAVLLPSLSPSTTANSHTFDTNIVLHSTVSGKGSHIATVDFGMESGLQYAVEDGMGNRVGVVWILEK